jgi:hypothetical protein
MRQMLLRLRRFRRRLQRELDAPMLSLALGIVLLAIGGALCWRPAGFLVPGAVITWMALPARLPFVVRDDPKAVPSSTPRKVG